MKPLRFLSLLLSHLVLFLMALNNLISGIWRIPVDPVLKLVPASLIAPAGSWWVRVYWLAALALPVVYWITRFVLWRRRPGALHVRTASGDQLLIHPGAIYKIVRHQIENHPAVVAQKLQVRQSGSRGLAVKALVTIRPIASLPQIKAELEAAIRGGLVQVMGIEKVDDIQIVMALDDKDLGLRPGLTTPAEPAPEPPLRSIEPPPAAPASTPASTAFELESAPSAADSTPLAEPSQASLIPSQHETET